MVKVGPLFLEGSNIVWELMFEINEDTREVRPTGCRDAHTKRQPEVYPDHEQVERAIELQKWAAQNDPDFVKKSEPWGNPWDKPRVSGDDDSIFGRN